MENEVFLQVPEHEDYFLSNLGNILKKEYHGFNRAYTFKSIASVKAMSGVKMYTYLPIKDKNGFRRISLPKMVATLFIPKNQNSSDRVKYITDNREDNSAKNIRWIAK